MSFAGVKRKNAFKSALLGGVSAAAVTAIAGVSQAQAANLTLNTSETWGSQQQTGVELGTVADATEGDNVEITADGVVLTVSSTSDDDNAGVNNVVGLGAVTDSSPSRNGSLRIDADRTASGTSVTLGSVNVGGDVTYRSVSTTSAVHPMPVTNNGILTVGGNFSVNNTGANLTIPNAMTWTQTGDVNVTGTTSVTANSDGAFNGASATLTLNGAANTFTGAVTVTGGGHADSDAKIDLDGAAATFTGGITLDDNGGQAILEISGSVAQTVTGSVSAGGDGEGEIVVNNNNGVTITGSVGSSTAALRLLTQTDGDITITGDAYVKTINAIAGHTLSFGGNVAADTSFNFSGDGTMTFNGASAQTVRGAITVSSGGDGTINVNNTGGGVTFLNKIGTSAALLGIMDVQGTSAVTFTEDDNHIRDFRAADNIRIILGGGVRAGDTVITTGTNLGITDNDTGSITVEVPVSITSGTVTLFEGNATAGMVNEITVDPNVLATYAPSLSGSNLILTPTAKSTAATASELGISTIKATVLANAGPAAGAAGDKEAVTAMTATLKAGGAGAIQTVEQVSVQADTLGAVSRASISTGAQVVGVASSRLASLRAGGQYTGVQTGFASGDGALARALWMKPFGNWIRQDAGKNTDGDRVNGYDADTYGVALGLDTELDDGVRGGASLAYSKTIVDGKGAGNANTNIDSYQVTAYGDYTVDKYYVEGMLGYARNNNKTSRRLTFGGLNRTANGHYDSNQYMFKVGGGVPVRLAGGAFLTPTGSLSYTHVSSGGYTERGAEGLNLKVTPDDVSALVGSLGAKVHARIKQGAGHLIPSATLGASYDFSGDEATATGRFTGSGGAFVVEGAEVEQLSGNAGLGLTYDNSIWSVSASYDAEARSDYIGHSATLEARLRF